MNINLSIVGQMLTFAILVWVTMKYVWPPLINAIDQRNKEIADGLAAGEEGSRRLAEAEQRTQEMLVEAEVQASARVRAGTVRRDEIVAGATDLAKAEQAKIVAEGQRQISAERAAMVRELQEQYADLVITGAGRILRREVDGKTHADIVDGLIGALGEQQRSDA